MTMVRWRSTTVSRLLLAAGLALVVVSGAHDFLAGEHETQFGLEQVLGCMLGLCAALAGAFLSPARRPVTGVTVRWAFAIYLAACSFALSVLGTTSAPTWVLFGYAAAICLLIPLRFGIATFAGLVALHLLATEISDLKVGLTGLPLTMLDVRIAIRNPAGLWNAVNLPQWTRHLFVAVILAALLGWLLQGMISARQALTRIRSHGVVRCVPARLVAVMGFGGLAMAYLDTLQAGMATDQATWEPAGVAEMAERVGVLPFLAYSHYIESTATGDIYGGETGAMPLSRDEVRQAVLQYMRFPADGEPAAVRILPNIAVVLAESTFDPGRAFRLEGDWNDELFVPGHLTAAAGALKVNALGGGTWITEFETIVGLDSRLFGYSGFYTHASVAPFVDRSMSTYLRAKGYTTFAFFPTEGDFYNSRRAYQQYGFEVVRDNKDLGHAGWIENDRAIVESVVSSLGAQPDAPFLAYVLLLENHAPHPCGTTDASKFTVRFAGVRQFEPNCALHEYLRRLDRTTAAVREMREYLADLEARSGRPYVLLVFGDHQPHTFTTTGGFQFDYAGMRTTPDPRITFFHFQSSAPSRLNCCTDVPPASMLPTLLSSFVANGPDDVYLGENLWLFSRCGSDAIEWQFGLGMVRRDAQVTDDRTKSCRLAYQRALASYRAAGVVRVAAGATSGG